MGDTGLFNISPFEFLSESPLLRPSAPIPEAVKDFYRQSDYPKNRKNSYTGGKAVAELASSNHSRPNYLTLPAAIFVLRAT